MAERKTPMPDDFAKLTRSALARAQVTGSDPAEFLHGAGLLLTPAVERGIEVAVLKRFADELMRWHPHEMLRRELPTGNPGTAADMYRAVQGFLDDFIQSRKGQQ
jgi:hypothetical protein